MPEQVLAILEAHASSAQAAAEGVLQVVHAHLWQAHPHARPFPGRCHHPRDWLAPVGENVREADPSPPFHHRLGNPIEHDQPLITVLDTHTRYDEDARAELRHFDLPVPVQRTDFLITAAGVDRESLGTRWNKTRGRCAPSSPRPSRHGSSRSERTFARLLWI